MKFKSYTIEGHSLGGIETALRIPEWRLALDVGRGRNRWMSLHHYALTHCHMDHCGGLPYILALRNLMGLQSPKIYAPPGAVAPLQDMVNAWDGLQRFESCYELIAAEPGQAYPLKQDLSLMPFRTYHPVPSVGYTISRSVRKLKPEFRGRGDRELAALKSQGTPITDLTETALLSVTGDTLPEVLDRQPQILKSETLVLECTFLDKRKPYQAARDGGHIHLCDLIERADAFENDTLVLSHFSQIYSDEDILRLLEPLAQRIKGRLLTLRTHAGGKDLEPRSA